MQKPSLSFLGAVLILAVVVGGLAGVISSVVINESIENYVEYLGITDSFVVISEVKPQALSGTYEEALDAVAAASSGSLAYVLPVNAGTFSEVVAVGVAVTSDGWILTDRHRLDAVAYDVVVDGDRFTVEEIIVDELSSAALLKVDTDGFSAPAFAHSLDIESGSLVFGVPGYGELIPTSVRLSQALLYESAPAEVEHVGWLLSDEVDSSMPVFDANGSLSAFVMREGVVPMHVLRPFVEKVLLAGEAPAAGIGLVTRVSTSQMIGVEHSGEVIADVIPGGSAALAGVKRGVLFEIDGQNVWSSALALRAYDPGDEITLGVLVDGALEEFNVTLGAFEDLVY